MCHGYRIADREPLREFEAEPEEESDELPETEPLQEEEEKPEQPIPTADD